jgi:hypothetical protein
MVLRGCCRSSPRWNACCALLGPLCRVDVTQKVNRASRRTLKSIGMTVIDEFDERGARQCLYIPADDRDGIWSRHAE